MLWGIDGNFEFNYIKKNIPFLTTDHCGTIRILDERILVEYLLIELERCKHIYGFDRELRSSLKNMKNIEISLPLLDNGDIDLNTQMSIIEQFNIIKELKNKIKDYREQIKNLKVEMNNDIKYKQNIKLSQIIDFSQKTNNSKFTKSFISLTTLIFLFVFVYLIISTNLKSIKKIFSYLSIFLNLLSRFLIF